MWWIELAAAGAAPRCTPLDEAEFRSYVLDAQSAIDRGDVDLPASILAELDTRLPCLEFPPQPRMWADLLVARAIVEFSRGGAWEPAMAAALRIRPAIDRGVGSGHPLATWEPPPPPPPGPPAPVGVRLYVDGMLSPTLPPEQGLYLVQKTDGRFWNTLLVEDQPLPPGWAADPVDAPPRIAAWGRAGVLLGGGAVTQTNDWGSDFYVDVGGADGQASVIGATGDLQATFFSPFGLLAQGTVAYMPMSPGLDGRISAIWAWKGLTLGGGAGLTSVDSFEQGEEGLDHRFRMWRYPEGTVLLRALHGLRLDGALTLGGSSAVTVADLGVGWLFADHVRLGLASTTRAGRFVEDGLRDRSLATTANRVMLRLDWVRGEY